MCLLWISLLNWFRIRHQCCLTRIPWECVRAPAEGAGGIRVKREGCEGVGLGKGSAENNTVQAQRKAARQAPSSLKLLEPEH